MGIKINRSENVNNSNSQPAISNKSPGKPNDIFTQARELEDKSAIPEDENLLDKFYKTSSKILPDLTKTRTAENNREAGKLTISDKSSSKVFSDTIKREIVYKDRDSGNYTKSTINVSSSKDSLITVDYIKEEFYGGPKAKSKAMVHFQYSKKGLENHIINNAKDAQGNLITRFKSIPEIRETPLTERTPEQKALLEEFDNMINYTIEAGTEYGVDPKYILSIIQREVCFDGLSDNVTGINGKGYMQLTSAPINDYLGYAGNKKYYDIKDAQYGPEVEELLVSRSFNPREAKTQNEKKELYKQIMKYLKDNTDAEFNIRLGTLVLRYYLNQADGDINIAAKNYNGSSIKFSYAKGVTKNYEQFSDTVPQKTTYCFNTEIS